MNLFHVPLFFMIICSNRRLSTFEGRVSFDRICLEMSQGEFDDISKIKTYIRGYLRLKVNGKNWLGKGDSAF